MATIKSRCRKLVLGPLGDDTVTSLLQDYLPDSDAEELKLLAAMGEGSIGRALNLRDAGGIALYGEMLELISTLPKTDTARLHGMVDAIARSRSEFGAYAEFDVFSELMGWWIARLVRAKATGVTPRELAPGEGALIARLSSVGSLDQWVEVWEKITRLFVRTTNVNLDRKQVLLNAFFALSRVGS
jgi:DNA polymerase-3 subunit delta'